jgi:hypothetical protein
MMPPTVPEAVSSVASSLKAAVIPLPRATIPASYWLLIPVPATATTSIVPSSFSTATSLRSLPLTVLAVTATTPAPPLRWTLKIVSVGAPPTKTSARYYVCGFMYRIIDEKLWILDSESTRGVSPELILKVKNPQFSSRLSDLKHCLD